MLIFRHKPYTVNIGFLFSMFVPTQSTHSMTRHSCFMCACSFYSHIRPLLFWLMLDPSYWPRIILEVETHTSVLLWFGWSKLMSPLCCPPCTASDEGCKWRMPEWEELVGVLSKRVYLCLYCNLFLSVSRAVYVNVSKREGVLTYKALVWHLISVPQLKKLDLLSRLSVSKHSF